MAVIIGVDIGQKRDPTAICVVENERRNVEGRKEIHFLVRHLERMPLGALYPQLAARVNEIAQGASLQGSRLRVYVNATQVGKPVVDLLDERLKGGYAIPVYFTHGNHPAPDGDREIKLGKACLVSRLQVLLQTGRLHLPRTSEANALAQ